MARSLGCAPYGRLPRVMHGCALRALPLPARTYPYGEQSIFIMRKFCFGLVEVRTTAVFTCP